MHVRLLLHKPLPTGLHIFLPNFIFINIPTYLTILIPTATDKRTYLPTYISTYFPYNLPIYAPTNLVATYLLKYLPIYIHIFLQLPTHLPTYYLQTYYFSKGCSFFLILFNFARLVFYLPFSGPSMRSGVHTEEQPREARVRNTFFLKKHNN